MKTNSLPRKKNKGGSNYIKNNEKDNHIKELINESRNKIVDDNSIAMNASITIGSETKTETKETKPLTLGVNSNNRREQLEKFKKSKKQNNSSISFINTNSSNSNKQKKSNNKQTSVMMLGESKNGTDKKKEPIVSPEKTKEVNPDLFIDTRDEDDYIEIPEGVNIQTPLNEGQRILYSGAEVKNGDISMTQCIEDFGPFNPYQLGYDEGRTADEIMQDIFDNPEDHMLVGSDNGCEETTGRIVEDKVETILQNERTLLMDDYDGDNISPGLDTQTNVIEETLIQLDGKYQTRDASWLKFNNRMLLLARDESIPLVERFKFLAITGSNLDEFTCVRLSKLYNKIHSHNLLINGMTSRQLYYELRKEINRMLNEQNRTLKNLLEQLKNTTGIEMINSKTKLSKEEEKFCSRYFDRKLRSMLTPMISDSTHPFPKLKTKHLYLGSILEDENDRLFFGTVPVPEHFGRIIQIKTSDNEPVSKFILIDELIKKYIYTLFNGMKLRHRCTYRILRNMDYEMNIGDEFIGDVIKTTLKNRENGDIMRVELYGNKKESNIALKSELKYDKDCVSYCDNVPDLSFCMDISELEFKPEIRKDIFYPKFSPSISPDVMDEDLFRRIDQEDIVLHHPYESYQTVVDFIKQAALDPDVLAIKQTLYRVSHDSPIMKALMRAAEAGKQVTVLLEVKARFDEANNLRWAAMLERVGGHVIYGVDKLKTHCKMCMVVKRNRKDELDKYVHLCTGNYNEKNAKIYTDISLFTSKRSITDDVEQLFNSLTGCSKPILNKIIASPYNLYDKLIENIDKQISLSKEGKKSRIYMKVNGLTDKSIIDKLYEAADNGVDVQLIVRSACGLEDDSKIKIKSIVGRFLEHSRIFQFGYGKDEEVYIGSADLMERNLYKRVEILVPLKGKAKDKVKSIMKVFINDNSPNAFDIRNNRGNDIESHSQNIFIKQAQEVSKLSEVTRTVYVEKKNKKKNKKKSSKEKVNVSYNKKDIPQVIADEPKFTVPIIPQLLTHPVRNYDHKNYINGLIDKYIKSDKSLLDVTFAGEKESKPVNKEKTLEEINEDNKRKLQTLIR